MNEQKYLTAEGAARLKQELEHLKGPERAAIAKRLREAISMGDLSENADYHKAKEDQGFLEGRIQEIEYLMQNAIIVQETQGDVVEVGVMVTIQEQGEEPETYQVVGAKEADPRNGKISHESPIGAALMGKRVGDTAEAHTPTGALRFKILKIE
jgi:transcription elongation factor GreA